MTSASVSTDRWPSARLAERAEHAELTHALEHGHVEAVQDQEAADEQRDAREEVEDHVQGQLLADLVGASPASEDLRAAPSDSLDALLERLGLAAVSATIEICIQPFGWSKTAGRLERHRGVAEAAGVEPAGEPKMPTISSSSGPWAPRPDPVADVVAAVRAQLRSSMISRPTRPAALDDAEVVGWCLGSRIPR